MTKMLLEGRSMGIFYRYIILAVLTFVCGVNYAYAEAEFPDEEGCEKRIKHFQKMCKPSESKNESTLVLFDTTDELRPEQIQFVLDNYVSEDVELGNEGDVLTIAKLDSKPVQMMDKTSICAPKPIEDCNWLVESCKELEKLNREFSVAAQCAVKKHTKEMKKAKKSFLIEAIAEVFRNKAYKLKNATKRKLILISDLYQNSKLLSFPEICRTKTTGQVTCPSLTQTMKRHPRLPGYLRKICGEKRGSLVFLPEDSMEIYYLVQGGRIDGSAEPWWTEFLVEHCGLERDNLKIVPELQK